MRGMKKHLIDLCCGGDKVSFEFNPNYTISTKLKFERRLKFDREIVESPTMMCDAKDECKDANHYIYNWSCNECNLIYVGSSCDCQKRKVSHTRACSAPKHKHHNIKLYQIMREYGGIGNWNMEIIDAFVANNKHDVQEREQEWIKRLKPSLNMINALKQAKVKEFDF